MEMNPERELPSPLDTPELPKTAPVPLDLPTDDNPPITLTQAAIDAAPLPMPMDTKPAPLTPARKKQASYGALISIVIIMAIVIVGAFYAWGKRIHDQGGLVPSSQAS